MIALKSENQILKKYIKDIKLQKINVSNHFSKAENNQSNEHLTPGKIEQMFQSLTNLNNYYYSYSILYKPLKSRVSLILKSNFDLF